jgi:hypothetical protein
MHCRLLLTVPLQPLPHWRICKTQMLMIICNMVTADCHQVNGNYLHLICFVIYLAKLLGTFYPE